MEVSTDFTDVTLVSEDSYVTLVIGITSACR